MLFPTPHAAPAWSPRGNWIAYVCRSPKKEYKICLITPDGQKASLCMGPSMEQQIIHDSFLNYLEATRRLGIDEPTARRILNSPICCPFTRTDEAKSDASVTVTSMS